MNEKVLQIGITGGIGSGKSLICKIFNILGIPTYDSDNRAKWLNNHHQAVINAIKFSFGDDFYQDGILDTKKLANEVFGNEEKLKILNAIVHPAVAEDYENWVKSHAHYPYVLKEAALIFETGIYKKLDSVITIFSPLSLRIKRIQERDKQRTKEEILAIIARQMQDEEKVKLANFVIYNNEETLLIPQILEIHQELIKLGSLTKIN